MGGRRLGEHAVLTEAGADRVNASKPRVSLCHSLCTWFSWWRGAALRWLGTASADGEQQKVAVTLCSQLWASPCWCLAWKGKQKPLLLLALLRVKEN